MYEIRLIKKYILTFDAVVFGYNFIPTGRDVNKMSEMTNQLAKFAK
jgi:hypothetical protein